MVEALWGTTPIREEALFMTLHIAARRKFYLIYATIQLYLWFSC